MSQEVKCRCGHERLYHCSDYGDGECTVGSDTTPYCDCETFEPAAPVAGAQEAGTLCSLCHGTGIALVDRSQSDKLSNAVESYECGCGAPGIIDVNASGVYTIGEVQRLRATVAAQAEEIKEHQRRWAEEWPVALEVVERSAKLDVLDKLTEMLDKISEATTPDGDVEDDYEDGHWNACEEIRAELRKARQRAAMAGATDRMRLDWLESMVLRVPSKDKCRIESELVLTWDDNGMRPPRTLREYADTVNPPITCEAPHAS